MTSSYWNCNLQFVVIRLLSSLSWSEITAEIILLLLLLLHYNNNIPVILFFIYFYSLTFIQVSNHQHSLFFCPLYCWDFFLCLEADWRSLQPDTHTHTRHNTRSMTPHVSLSKSTDVIWLPALRAGGCSWYPVSWHQPTGYRSGDSQSTHWSYSSSQPSKCIRSNLWTMRVTVATQTSLGSMRSTASSFIPGRNPWLGTSWRRTGTVIYTL